MTIYVDSGAGQSLCSCSSAFADMTPCKVEIEGVAGSLQIYGCGTALFLVNDAMDQPFILRVHNCLYGQGQFNLLSVSQICQNVHNSVDFALQAPALLFGSNRRKIRLPLVLDEGLFAISALPSNWTILGFLLLGRLMLLPEGCFARVLMLRHIGGLQKS